MHDHSGGDFVNYGGYFRANGVKGRGLLGYATGSNGYGVLGEATGSDGRGVYGRATNKGDAENYGGYFTAGGTSGRGVYGEAKGDGGTGVFGRASGGGGWGGRFIANNGIGIVAMGRPAAFFQGNVTITVYDTGTTVMELGEGLDYAEGFDVSEHLKEEIKPGAVLVIDPVNPGKLVLSTAAYDTKVAGIVAGANGKGSGVKLGAGQFDQDVALAGRVYCMVDASHQAVKPGDLLTTSATPGHAMKATDYGRANGAILGKAMEILEIGEKRQILVLVTLQ